METKQTGKNEAQQHEDLRGKIKKLSPGARELLHRTLDVVDEDPDMVYAMSIEEVRAELKELGIDTGPLVKNMLELFRPILHPESLN